jgi:hypothetical protein
LVTTSRRKGRGGDEKGGDRQAMMASAGSRRKKIIRRSGPRYGWPSEELSPPKLKRGDVKVKLVVGASPPPTLPFLGLAHLLFRVLDELPPPAH